MQGGEGPDEGKGKGMEIEIVEKFDCLWLLLRVLLNRRLPTTHNDDYGPFSTRSAISRTLPPRRREVNGRLLILRSMSFENHDRMADLVPATEDSIDFEKLDGLSDCGSGPTILSCSNYYACLSGLQAIFHICNCDSVSMELGSSDERFQMQGSEGPDVGKGKGMEIEIVKFDCLWLLLRVLLNRRLPTTHNDDYGPFSKRSLIGLNEKTRIPSYLRVKQVKLTGLTELDRKWNETMFLDQYPLISNDEIEATFLFVGAISRMLPPRRREV
nr:hypothetical protein [Tanacetum cinerariifolium]